jgi:nucleoside-diphosphate-sugar epimerase
LAGAAGAIGQRLVPLLIEAGHQVVGTTRSASKADGLRAAGASPVVVDMYDAPAVHRAVADARPDVVVHQLTDLPQKIEPGQMMEAIQRNARIRREGTQNLVDAALAAGVRRMIAQSIAWIYAPGPEPHDEDAPLDLHAQGLREITVGGVVALERLVLHSPPLDGVVLRYGHLYGAHTGAERADPPAVHVDAAAGAALLAIENARSTIYNIAEPNAYASTDRARRELGFESSFRCEASFTRIAIQMRDADL